MEYWVKGSFIQSRAAFSERVNLHLHDHEHPIKDLDLRVLSQNGPIKVLYFPESLFNWRQLFERRRQNVRESIQCPTMTLFPSSLESLCPRAIAVYIDFHVRKD